MWDRTKSEKRVPGISKLKAHIGSVITHFFLPCCTEHDNKSSTISSLCYVPTGITTEVSNNVRAILLPIVTDVKSVAMPLGSSNPKQERYFMYTLLTNTVEVHSFNQVKASTDRRLLKKQMT
jgi:hypothetical protein